MNEKDNTCQRCGTEIGGKAFYIIRLDCIYDGEEVSACKSVIVCSECHEKLKSWLHIPEE
jgi:hypothetical protein